MKMGILVVNKDKDMTSHDVVSLLRKKLKMKRIGHTGTLDPLATGVLPICIGNATRVSDYIMKQGKSYIATLEFGKSTTTYDSEGDVVNISENKIFTLSQVENVLKTFIGEIEQIPPIYSAIKIKGKKLYEYARDGKDVNIEPRKVKIYDIKIKSLNNERLTIEVSCSKGTYIRTLVNDIGLKLNTYAFMTDLIRTRVGNFHLKDSITIDEIQKCSIEQITDRLIDVEDTLYNLQKIYIEEDVEFRLINGQKINIFSLESLDNNNLIQDCDSIIIVRNKFIGIGKISKNILKMEKVLCL